MREGDAVVVNSPKERRRNWTFVAHVLNEASGEEWVEVRGGRPGEAKGRAFLPDLIYPARARRGSRIEGLSLAKAAAGAGDSRAASTALIFFEIMIQAPGRTQMMAKITK